MPPDYETLMLPLLRLVAGGQCPIRAATSAMANEFRLTENERQILLPSGRTLLVHSRVHWAATYLVQSGLLSRRRRGILQITRRGRGLLAESPPRINNELLLRFEEFRAFRSRSQGDRGSERNEPLPLWTRCRNSLR